MSRWRVIAAAGVLLLSILLGFLVRWQLLSRLARLAQKTSWAADSAVIASLRRPLPVWFFLGGLYASSRIVDMPVGLARMLEKTLGSVLIVSTTLWLANLVARLLELRGGHGAGLATAASSTGVVRSAVRILVLGMGALVLLGSLGISVTPILTTMGFGGLAVALGLRETLANLFAGMQITLAGNIGVGDFVKLQSGEEGYIEDIQWRVTRLKTLFNTFVVIPNSQLADSVVTNYHLPSQGVAILVPIGVHAASDLEHVERVTHDVARTILTTVPGGAAERAPLVRYMGIGDSSVDFNVILWVREYPDSLLIRHEFIKALVRAFASEGIVIPFPVRAINLDQEGAGARARVGSGAGAGTSSAGPMPPND